MSGVHRLIRLYPRRWRDRYQDEFVAVIEDLNADHHLVGGLGVDIIWGAWRAHHVERSRMAEKSTTGVRTGARDGVVVAALLAVVVVLTNGIFPTTGGDQAAPVAAGYLVIAAVLVAIGVRAERRSADPNAAVKASAMASFIIAELVTAAFLIVNNIFWPTVRRQHDKIVAFQASHWSDMRAFTNVATLRGAAVLAPVSIIGGAALGLCARFLARWRVRPQEA